MLTLPLCFSETELKQGNKRFFRWPSVKIHPESARLPHSNNLKNTRVQRYTIPCWNSYGDILRSSLLVPAHRPSTTRKLNSLQMQGSLKKKTKTYRHQPRAQDGSNMAPRYSAKLTPKSQMTCNVTRVRHKSIWLSFTASCLGWGCEETSDLIILIHKIYSQHGGFLKNSLL